MCIRDRYYSAVKYVYEKGLMDGVDVGVFAPNDTLTRAMVWTIIARAEGVEMCIRDRAGTVCAVTGLADSYPGEGLGFEPDAASPALEPVLRYRVILPAGSDAATALRQLRELEQEDPALHVVWDERLGEAFLQLMGEVQLLSLIHISPRPWAASTMRLQMFTFSLLSIVVA